MYSGFRNDVSVESVAKVDRVDVIAMVHELATDVCDRELGPLESGVQTRESILPFGAEECLLIAYHSRSLYIIVKKTWRKRLTALMSTAIRNSHASPDIMRTVSDCMDYPALVKVRCLIIHYAR